MNPPRHPSLARFVDDWRICRDVAAGESAVKRAGLQYLPATPGMWEDGLPSYGTDGYRAYEAYLSRAVFPSVFAEAVGVALGVLHREPAVVSLPDKLEPMRERATPEGATLESLLRQINAHQLITGRVGLLLDMPDEPSLDTPFYVALYGAESVVNWDSDVRGLNLVVLDESGEQRIEGDNWKRVESYRRLSFEDGAYTVEIRTAGDFDRSLSPVARGRRPDEIPFTFVNAGDLRPEPDEPPLVGLARLALAIYRGEADYRQSLHLQGQDTLVVIGGGRDEEVRVGAGAAIHLPTQGDAKFIGPDSSGLPEQRSALENDYKRAARLGLGLLDVSSRERESGEALRTRVASATASLTSIALAGAAGLENALKQAARWAEADPDEVSVEPNLDFSGTAADPRDLVEILNARSLGAPLSLRSVHDILRERDMTQMTFEDELAAIADEGDAGLSDAPDVDV